VVQLVGSRLKLAAGFYRTGRFVEKLSQSLFIGQSRCAGGIRLWGAGHEKKKSDVVFENKRGAVGEGLLTRGGPVPKRPGGQFQVGKSR